MTDLQYVKTMLNETHITFDETNTSMSTVLIARTGPNSYYARQPGVFFQFDKHGKLVTMEAQRK